jgi:hypothetical protein
MAFVADTMINSFHAHEEVVAICDHLYPWVEIDYTAKYI